MPVRIFINMITAKTITKNQAFAQAAAFLPMYREKLLSVRADIQNKAQEIRLRAGQPVTLEFCTGREYIEGTRVTCKELHCLLEHFCGYSVYSYSRQLSEGFITLEGGHRAGLCGTAVTDDGAVTAIRNITSVNVRIAREFAGCSDELYRALIPEAVRALLIIGRPVSAKTTVLRDLARNLSQEHKVAVIDERGEIGSSGTQGAGAGFNLGRNTDILDGYPKRAGFLTALRALSPEYILCDEIAGDGGEMAQCLNSGVRLILTAHCGSLEEAVLSHALSGVIKHISHIALLGTGGNIGRLMGLWRREDGLKGEKKDAYSFSSIMYNSGVGCRAVQVFRA